MAVGAELTYEGEQILKEMCQNSWIMMETILQRCSLPIHVVEKMR